MEGWVLSPAYDINPNEFGKGLHLNISESENSLSLELALEVAEYFRLDQPKGEKIIKQVKKSVSGWREVAKKYKIPRQEQDRMAQAFLL